jgi:3-oxoacyl-[acyl-carrier-protein] synthase II
MNTLRLPGLLRENPVVVTGIGAFSSAGAGVAALTAAALAGRSLARERDFPGHTAPQRFAVCAAPEVDSTRPELSAVRKMDRCVQMAALAAREAWQQAAIAEVYPPERIGLVVGSSRGPLGKRVESLGQTGIRPPRPSLAANTTFAAVSGVLARTFKIKGPGAMISATCASAAFAIISAAEQIVLGNADAMLVGGTEAPLQAALLAQLHATGVLGSHAEAERTCCPFDVNRNGLVLGEGSAFLVLESAQAVADRRASCLGRLAGWAAGVDASGRTGVDAHGTGLGEGMRRALHTAGLPPENIDYINVHGTGTRLNDLAEARAVAGVFDDKVPCTSTKPVTGHCLGASAALEAVLCLEMLRLQIIAPTANCRVQDPLCAVNVLALEAQPAKLRAVLSNSSGFWGYHASLIFEGQ